MSRDRDLRDERDKKIKEEYQKLASKKVGDVELYRHEAMLVILSKKFWLSPVTINNILKMQ